MTTEPPAPAAGTVPDEYNSGHGVTVCEAENEVMLYLWHEGPELMDPDDADDLADALKAHAAAARERAGEEGQE